jgi:GGDEF domain-containing protein
MAENLRLQREILRQSRMDALTQAFNRHHFVEQRQAVFAAALGDLHRHR